MQPPSILPCTPVFVLLRRVNMSWRKKAPEWKRSVEMKGSFLQSDWALILRTVDLLHFLFEEWLPSGPSAIQATSHIQPQRRQAGPLVSAR
ncbi:hypothetical protein EYF80_049722 [Liparis tanakae]|uniref:Uncharacterized protein n=1 Tax=Liparis tanakae TaxID=230148 RepID=A0A4Z2FG27_9TELE|nr:hypothetical protein EYF80_049722 [Liparis tanakae]